MLSRRTFVALGASLVGFACGGCDADATQSAQEQRASEREQLAAQKKRRASVKAERASRAILVAYFSRAGENYVAGATEWLDVGHTAQMAAYIKEELDCDSFEIRAKDPYPEIYQDCLSRAKEEQDADARPKIDGTLPDLQSYDILLLGFPIWWGQEPQIIHTFLEAQETVGRIIIPFVTHEGSGLGMVAENIKGLVPEAGVWDGYAVRGGEVEKKEDDIRTWVGDLGLR